MNLNTHWRKEYSKNRYLKHLSQKQLDERGKYLIENITTLEPNGKIGARPVNSVVGYKLWMLFTHSLQELVHRNSFFSEMFLLESYLPKSNIELRDRLVQVFNLYNKNKPHLIKYGKMEWIKTQKVSLASTFNDPSLNLARVDDEMKVVFLPDPNEVQLTQMNGTPINGILSAEIHLAIDRDYYIYCTSHTFDYRLFNDFEADCCLFIYDSERFSTDLLNAVETAVAVEDYAYKKVSYFDPVKPDKMYKDVSIEFHKHIRYLYQNEYRHVFIPTQNKPLKKSLFLRLPKLNEYSEVISL